MKQMSFNELDIFQKGYLTAVTGKSKIGKTLLTLRVCSSISSDSRRRVLWINSEENTRVPQKKIEMVDFPPDSIVQITPVGCFDAHFRQILEESISTEPIDFIVIDTFESFAGVDEQKKLDCFRWLIALAHHFNVGIVLVSSHDHSMFTTMCDVIWKIAPNRNTQFRDLILVQNDLQHIDYQLPPGKRYRFELCDSGVSFVDSIPE